MSDLGYLGVKSEYKSHYDASLLFPIARAIKRQEIGVDEVDLPFYGVDIWNHYEISWLNINGKPNIALGVITIPVNSKYLIESKSMKLYFNSFNNTKFQTSNDLIQTVISDISNACGMQINFELLDINSTDNLAKINQLDINCLDDLDISFDQYIPNSSFLTVEDNFVTTSVYSNLLKSNCLVTSQPDWATIVIEYSGKMINESGLLRYIVSFRNHNEFHEQCVERIFTDISKHCKPDSLLVYARYTRRGGLDINPYRSSKNIISSSFNNLRFVRQ